MGLFLRPISVMRTLPRRLPHVAALALCRSLSFSPPAARAQKRMPVQRPPQNGVYATCIRPNELYSAADQSTPPIAEVVPGREMVIVDQNGKWLRVFANTDPPDTRQSDQPEFGTEAPPPISGWMLDQAIVTTNTPNGDLIVFGAADAAEEAASVSNPPPGMAEQARLLYRRVVTMFPQSHWIAEAMYRAADIRWEIQKADAATLPSAHEKETFLREQMDENEMRDVLKYFPGTQAGPTSPPSTSSTTSSAATGRDRRNAPRRRLTTT